jgi:hypothetical protein
MGMDVIGKNPTSEKGAYFRNNVWWWRPLAEYCLTHDVANSCHYWHSNDGDGLDEDGAMELARKIQSDLDKGVVAEFERKHNGFIGSLPMIPCEWCHSTGIRSDEVGVQHGMPTRELEEPQAIILGRTHGWCNACQGLGEREQIATSYGFSEENVKEFVEFLLDCGGFEIW